MDTKDAKPEQQALRGKLKSAFNSAVFLGYQKSAELLRQALEQVAPLSEAEKKTVEGVVTEAQLRADIEKAANGPSTRLSHKVLAEKRRQLEAQALNNSKLLRADAAAARKLATEVTGQPALADIILEAQYALPLKTPSDQYYRELPRKRGSGGVLFIEDGKLLVVETTYGNVKALEIPGGTCDKNKSPRETAIRECQEELGIKPRIGQLLCLDYRRGTEKTGDAEHHLFLGARDGQEINMDYVELALVKWLPIPEALAEMAKSSPELAGRVSAAIAASESGTFAYCEEGKLIPPQPAPAPKAAAPQPPRI